MSQRDTKGVVDWYQAHEQFPTSLAFDPDGMCQKIVRTARRIGPGAPSALADALATPEEFRVYKVEKMRTGMTMHFDDPNDSNPFGHVVTITHEIPGMDMDDPDRLVTRSNSVKSNIILPVRSTYFKKFWGDPRMFASKMINGVPLDLPNEKPKKAPWELPPVGIKRLERWIDILERMKDNHPDSERIQKALTRDQETLEQTIRRLSKKDGSK